MAKSRRTAPAAPTATVADVMAALDRIAPPHLAEEWDNVGLQIGDPAAPVRRVMVALEASRAVVEEATRRGADMLVTHHPLIFRPARHLVETGPVGVLVGAIIRGGMAMACAHTNLDSVACGTNGVLADLAGLQVAGRRFLVPAAAPSDTVKYIVYTPPTHVEAVTAAIAAAGAAVIGKYTHCTFRTPGTGTYMPTEGANPFAGKVGRLEQAEEVRIECLCPRALMARVMIAVRGSHPYEEIAQHFLPVEAVGPATAGLGLVGTLKRPTTLGALGRQLRRAVAGGPVAHVGDAAAPIETVAICTGSGGDLIRTWRPGTADVFITGEMSHHDAHEAAHRGVNVLLVGHFASERIVCEPLAGMLANELAAAGCAGVEVEASAAEEDPLRWL